MVSCTVNCPSRELQNTSKKITRNLNGRLWILVMGNTMMNMSPIRQLLIAAHISLTMKSILRLLYGRNKTRDIKFNIKCGVTLGFKKIIDWVAIKSSKSI